MTAASGLPPGRSPDQLSWPMAVILPSLVAPMRMRWIVAGRCGGVVEIKRPLQRHLHRPPGGARAERGQHRVGAQEQLPAEAAADEGRYEANLLLGDAERLGQVAPRSNRSSGWRSRP